MTATPFTSMIASRLRHHAEQKRAGREREAMLAEEDALAIPRSSLLEFVRYAWWNTQPFAVGLHTRAICQRIDRAIEDYRAGKSTYLVITVPFRHGKSDLVSRALPAYFLGRCSDTTPDIICTSYAAALSQEFSRRCRLIVDSWQYQKLFPGVRRSSVKDTEAWWKVDYREDEGDWRPSPGEVKFVGLGGAITGSGYHLGIVDDYCASREEAESQAYRDATWNAFTDSFLTRAAPTSITIITATPWHVDDLIGRIKAKMGEDEHFPRFEFLSFPAKGPANEDGVRTPYPTPYLFPERFSEQWYRESYAKLGSYSAAGLLDCEPTVREGNLFKMDGIRVHRSAEEFPACRYVRFWDLASTQKEVVKDDPDFTVGALVGLTSEKSPAGGTIQHLWILDLVVGQWMGPDRDEKIKATATMDGPGVRQAIEQVGGYKDAVETLKRILRGVRSVEGIVPHGDKLVRATPMEPIFEAGNVHILKAGWNGEFEKQFREFPSGKHDDVVDAVGGGYRYLDKNPLMMPFDRKLIGV